MSSTIEITPELMAGFLDEAPEYLDMLDAGLMELESKAGTGVLSLDDPDDQEQMNVMFRAAHSLKGLAAAFGFENIKELTHRMETLFDQVRMRKRDLTSESFETLFQVFDRLKSLVQELSDNSDEPVQIDDILNALDQILEMKDGTTGAGVSVNPKEELQDALSDSTIDTTENTEIDIDSLVESAIEQSTNPEPVDNTIEASPMISEAVTSELFDDPELAALFVETTVEAIEELNQALLGLEENPAEPELLNTVFRCAHNIKGASGAASLNGMNRVTHDMETVLDHLRNGRLTLCEQLMNAIFQVVDRLRVTIDNIKEGTLDDIAEDEMCNHFQPWIEQCIASINNIAPANSPEPALDESLILNSDGDLENNEPLDKDSSADNDSGLEQGNIKIDEGDRKLKITVTFADDFDESCIQAYLIHNKLSELGTMISSNPDIDTVTGDSEIHQIEFILATDVDPAELERIACSFDADRVLVSECTGSTADHEKSTQHEEAEPVSVVQPTPVKSTTPRSVDKTVDVPSSPPVQQTTTEQIVTPVASAASNTPAPIPKPSSTSIAEKAVAKQDGPQVKSGETLRVDQERLDQLMNLGGELVINRARFVQIHGKFRDVFNGKNIGFLVDDMTDRMSQLHKGIETLDSSNTNTRDMDDFRSNMLHLSQSFNTVRSLVSQVHELRTAMFDFDEALHGLSRVSEGIQKGIMSTRMVSIGPLFSRFRRVIRDISKSTGKKVDLVLRGETTELDKRMVDELGDPLTHMVRNSVDHGIEQPDVRVAAGKNPTGQVILEASHRGNSICIEVIDDGAGLNIDRIKSKIIERELATPAQVESMSNRELYQYIFKPGFSTAEVVTDLSGRGMGMDIVVSKIEKLSGTVEVDSTPGQGSHVTIKLPLTLAILTSLVAKIGQGVYALPLETVAEIITIRRDEIQWIQKRPVVRVRDRVVPIVFYEDIFTTDSDNLVTASKSDPELTLVIIGFEKDKIGLVVDELLGQEDVVIKSIAENYENVRGFAGASIRGDGSVSLILDVTAMMELAFKPAAHESLPAPAPTLVEN